MQTPHIAGLVAEGVRLGSFYVRATSRSNRSQGPQPYLECVRGVIMTDTHGIHDSSLMQTFKFCSPSRSQTLTGRFAYHLGQQTQLNLNPMTGCEFDSTQGQRSAYMCSIKCGLSPNYSMLPAVLKTQNYSTHALASASSHQHAPTHSQYICLPLHRSSFSSC